MTFLTKFTKSFKFALKGLRILWRNEPNFRLHLSAAAIVIILMMLLGVARADVVIILMMITFVLTLEIANTVVE